MEDDKQTQPDPPTTTLTTSTTTEPSQPSEDSFDNDWEIVDESLKTVDVDFKIRQQS